MVNPPGLIVFCAPLKAGSQGRGGGGAWAVAEGKKIETNFLHESHQWTKRGEFVKKFYKSMLHFPVFAEGRNNYIRSGFLRVYNSFIHCAKYLLIFRGFGGISPLGEYGGICFSF
jgi:hypothetical protein